jgi:hypothetical protein
VFDDEHRELAWGLYLDYRHQGPLLLPQLTTHLRTHFEIDVLRQIVGPTGARLFWSVGPHTRGPYRSVDHLLRDVLYYCIWRPEPVKGTQFHASWDEALHVQFRQLLDHSHRPLPSWTALRLG